MKRAFFIFALMCFLATGVSAQFTVAPQPQFQAWTNSFTPCGGCLLYSYIAGSSTPQATFTDATGGTPNSNPVVLNSAGRANVWFGPTAYKLVLQTPTGFTIYTVDQLIANVSALLALNNVWTGTNQFNGLTTFNSLATFNAGLTSSGPNTLNGGGTITGTWSGSPTFSGTPNFSGGLTLTGGLTLSGQLTSTVSTGTPPFVIASTTAVPNLNASLLLGCTWAVPCALGTTTPNTGAFTTLTATTLSVGGGTTQTGIQGTDTKLLTAGTVAGGAGNGFCTDVNGGATTSGCTTSGFTKIQAVTFCASGCTATGTPCTTGASANSTCTNTVNWPGAFADTNYAVACSGVNFSGDPFLPYVTKTTSSVTVYTSNGQGSAAVASSFSEVDCQGIHP